jgi:hypothetical protein
MVIYYNHERSFDIMETTNKKSTFYDAVYETTELLLYFQKAQRRTIDREEPTTIREKIEWYMTDCDQYTLTLDDIGTRYDCTKYTNLIKRYMGQLTSTWAKQEAGRSVCKFYADMGKIDRPIITIDHIYIDRVSFGSNIEFLNDGTIIIKVFMDVVHSLKIYRFNLANIRIDDINSSSYDTTYYSLFDMVIASLRNVSGKDVYAESIDTTANIISRIVIAKFLTLIVGKKNGDSILYRFVYGDTKSTTDESSRPITITVKSSKYETVIEEIEDKEALHKLSASRDLNIISDISCLGKAEKNRIDDRMPNDLYISNMSSIIKGIKYRASLYPELNSEYCKAIAKNVNELAAVAAATMVIGSEGIDKKKELSFQVDIKDIYGNTEPVTISIFIEDNGYMVSYTNSDIIKGRYFIPFVSSAYYCEMLHDGYYSVFSKVDDMKESIYYQSKDIDIDHFNFIKKKLQAPIVKNGTKIDEAYMMRKPLISAAVYVTLACINLISHNDRKIIVIDSDLLR